MSGSPSPSLCQFVHCLLPASTAAESKTCSASGLVRSWSAIIASIASPNLQLQTEQLNKSSSVTALVKIIKHSAASCFYPTLPPRKGRANAVQTFYRLLASYPMSWIHHWSPPSFGAVVCTKCLCKHLRQCCTTIQKGQGGWELLIPLYTFGSACSQNGHRI